LEDIGRIVEDKMQKGKTGIKDLGNMQHRPKAGDWALGVGPPPRTPLGQLAFQLAVKKVCSDIMRAFGCHI